MSKPSKPRITLADLAAVEIPKASLVTDTLEPALPEPREPSGTPAATDALSEGATEARAAESAGLRAARSGSGSLPAASDLRDLSAMPEGVSPEVAKLLAIPEPEPEPEADEIVTAAAPSPAAAPPKKSKAGMFVVLGLIAAGAVAWFATHPAPMDLTAHGAEIAIATARTSPESLVGFQAIPEPIIAAPEVEPEAASPAPRERTRRRRADDQVRSGDLF